MVGIFLKSFSRVGLKVLSPFHKHENGSELTLSVHQFVELQIVIFCMSNSNYSMLINEGVTLELT